MFELHFSLWPWSSQFIPWLRHLRPVRYRTLELLQLLIGKPSVGSKVNFRAWNLKPGVQTFWNSVLLSNRDRNCIHVSAVPNSFQLSLQTVNFLHAYFYPLSSQMALMCLSPELLHLARSTQGHLSFWHRYSIVCLLLIQRWCLPLAFAHTSFRSK